MTFLQQLAKRQAVGFRLSTAQAKKLVGGILHLSSVPYATTIFPTWGPQGLPGHLRDEERENPRDPRDLAAGTCR